MYDVILYSQPGCTHCTITLRKLNKLGVPHTVIDISTNDEAAAHLKAEGWSTTPIIEVHRGGEIVAAWNGVRPDALNALGASVSDMGAFDKRVGA